MLKKLLKLTLLCLPIIAYGQINKCVVNGKIVYSDKVCPADTSKALAIPAQKQTSTSPPHSETVSRTYKNTHWYQDAAGYQQALDISTSEHAPIFIYAYTDWCGYCKNLDRTLLADPEVQAILSKFVKVKINPEHGDQDKKLFKSWGGQGYPGIFSQTKTQNAPKKTPKPYRKIKGQWQLMSKTDFIAMLQVRLDAYR